MKLLILFLICISTQLIAKDYFLDLHAKVIIDEKVYASINHGILLLVGFDNQDQDLDLNYYVKKILNLRIFNDENGKMNHSLLDVKGSILVVSQFTCSTSIKSYIGPSHELIRP